MDRLRILVIYYSMEKSTQLVAEAIADATGAELAELQPLVEPRVKGFARYLLYGWQRLLHPRMPIAPPSFDPQDYDLIFIGTPVWAFQAAPAVQTLLRIMPMTGRHVALFCTHRGGPGPTLALMRRALPAATILGSTELADVQIDAAAARKTAAAWAKEIVASRSHGQEPYTP